MDDSIDEVTDQKDGTRGIINDILFMCNASAVRLSAGKEEKYLCTIPSSKGTVYLMELGRKGDFSIEFRRMENDVMDNKTTENLPHYEIELNVGEGKKDYVLILIPEELPDRDSYHLRWPHTEEKRWIC
ncbi:MAG: hypothetical protein R6U32_03725 [Candidatus Woesearchaeota archaeon]